MFCVQYNQDLGPLPRECLRFLLLSIFGSCRKRLPLCFVHRQRCVSERRSVGSVHAMTPFTVLRVSGVTCFAAFKRRIYCANSLMAMFEVSVSRTGGDTPLHETINIAG